MKKNLFRIKTNILFIVFVFFFCVAAQVSFGQIVSVQAKLDSTQMWIGNQTALVFEVVQQKKHNVLFPIFSDTIVGNLEIVQQAKHDTIKISDENIQINAEYTVTSFEDSLVYIPAYPFVDADGDTVWSNSLSIRIIQPFLIDTASNQLADIKPVYKPPFNWKRFLLRSLLVILLVGLAFVLYLLVRKLITKKPAVEAPKPKVVIPAHDEAFSRLDKLKEQKLWQSGRVKEYHTELTDIIRVYIEKMFNIGSMEMTSDEILNHVKFIKTDKEGAYKALRQILTLADLVKFAKWNPSPSDNELSMMNAYLFVNQTKVEEVKPLATGKEKG